MMITKLIITWIVLALLCLGCAARLNERVAESNFTDQIKEGVTTKQEVRTIFGEPTSITTSTFGETWMYFVRTTGEGSVGQYIAAFLVLPAGSKPLKDTIMIISFNQDGTVNNKTITNQSHWGRYRN